MSKTISCIFFKCVHKKIIRFFVDWTFIDVRFIWKIEEIDRIVEPIRLSPFVCLWHPVNGESRSNLENFLTVSMWKNHVVKFKLTLQWVMLSDCLKRSLDVHHSIWIHFQWRKFLLMLNSFRQMHSNRWPRNRRQALHYHGSLYQPVNFRFMINKMTNIQRIENQCFFWNQIEFIWNW